MPLGLERVRGNPSVLASLEVIGPAREHAQNLMLSLLHHMRELVSPGLAWWRKEIRRSRAVQVGSVIVLIALILLMAWALKPKPATPWQKLHRALGL